MRNVSSSCVGVLLASVYLFSLPAVAPALAAEHVQVEVGGRDAQFRELTKPTSSAP